MIRPATREDQAFITELAHVFDRFGPYVPVFRDMLLGNRPALAQQGVIGAVDLFIHEDPAGQRTSFIAVEWRQEEGVGHIHGVVVDERFRRQGLAVQLLDHVEKLARQRRIATLECLTGETENVPALCCFEQWGFSNNGRVGRYPHGQFAVSLRRTLN